MELYQIYRLAEAARHTIAPLTHKFREEHLTISPLSALHSLDSQPYYLCSLTNKRLKHLNEEVDHIYPHTFLSLLYAFINAHQLDPLDIFIVGECFESFVDKAIEESIYEWYYYYQSLRIIHKDINASLPNQYRGCDDNVPKSYKDLLSLSPIHLNRLAKMEEITYNLID